ITGILSGTTSVFFAYVGFDLASTVAEECTNPKEDLPIAIMSVVPYTMLNNSAPLSVAVNLIGMKWLGIIMDIGAVIGLISVILALLMGQPRILYAMANDGFLPTAASNVNHTTLIGGIIAAISAALFPINVLSELMCGGTLLAFFTVNVGVAVLRFTAPEFERKFKDRVPFWVPLL
ncbi:2852_t:CDS:2, partial [Racocetra fulgida]